MLACYVPNFPIVRIGEEPADVGAVHTLLYRKFWLIIRWEGLRTTPRIAQASVSAYGRSIQIQPERVAVLSKAAFDEWYTAHWRAFHT